MAALNCAAEPLHGSTAAADLSAEHVDAPLSGGELVDAALLTEIGLLADVITAISGHSGHLTPDEVDSLLGVRGVPTGRVTSAVRCPNPPGAMSVAPDPALALVPRASVRRDDGAATLTVRHDQDRLLSGDVTHPQ